ncbi:unnamed protein product [Schistosoma margrebowiei]|uniref:GPI ethanolamine phosphate transferase 1 n=1 Tax=Schistosoma margrebowiei TaxID=48269 RepID=A0A183MGV0_9TREM|nr:unnamed protein product [Schistosoma margrebowiei]
MPRIFEVLGIIVMNLVQFYSIFDIYYTSPLTNGMNIVPLNISAPTTHVIFMVSDGLRADKIFSQDMEYTPFLRDVLLHRGLWGVSHTRVPTESRPAHVAMLGGFNEDVASITKGWKTNPVEFDSVLNRSFLAWIWGYKEVVMSFVPPSTNHVKATPCPDELSDLAKTNPTEIDRWVVNQFLDFVDYSGDFFDNLNATSSDYRQGRMIFLHLDAADMVGHSFKPDSHEYTEVLLNLDNIVFQVYHKLTEKSRGTDSRIAYILTSDHGMTEWGSHGAGSFHETVTPLLIWGSGIVGPLEIETNVNNLSEDKIDMYGLPLHNYGRLRREIQQADLCPLMASLLGIPIPVNSIGQVPVEFLKIPEYDKAKLTRANWLQIYGQLKIKYAEKKKSHFSILFREFPSLKMSDINNMENACESLISSGKYHEAIWGFFHRYLLSLACLLFALWPYIDGSFRPHKKVWDLETSTDDSIHSAIQNQYPCSESPLNLKGFRQSLFFIFLLIIGFFGTGNIASINSFDPRSTFCFTTILNPALMAILLLIKVMCPMLFLGVIYAAIQLHNGNYSSSINNQKSKRGYHSILAQTGVTAVLSNLIAIHFFVWLKDEGSWLDIGTSISHYVIAMSISLAGFLFTLLGKEMLSFSVSSNIHQKLLKVSNKYV